MSTLPALGAPIVIPPVIGAVLLDVRVEGDELLWRCPACGATNPCPAVLLHEQDCPVEAHIVAALRRFEMMFQVRA